MKSVSQELLSAVICQYNGLKHAAMRYGQACFALSQGRYDRLHSEHNNCVLFFTCFRAARIVSYNAAGASRPERRMARKPYRSLRMSEQDPNLSSRLEAVLLAKLARQEERLCLLEARLAQAEPAIEAAPPLAAEREPIRLPEFNGPDVNAIAALVQEKATQRMRPVAAPDVLPQATTAQPLLAEEAAEPGYERTARLNAPLLRRYHSARKEPNYSMFRKAGSVALLSIAVAAIGVGLWQQRQSAFISVSTPDTRPIPLLTPPAPLPAPHPLVSSSSRSSKPLRSVRLFTGKPPILEPRNEPPAPLPHARRIVVLSSAALSGARSHLNSTAPQIASHAFASNRISPARQIEHQNVADTATRGFKSPRALRSHLRQAGASDDNAQPVGSPQTSGTVRAERPSVSRSNSELSSNPDTMPNNPQSFSSSESPEYRVGESSRRRYSSDERERVEAARRAVGLSPRHRRANPAESSEETQTNSEESPRRQLQGNSRRAMRTLDEMRDLLDSIERRKRRQADAESQ